MKTRLFLLAAAALLAFSSNSSMALTVPVAQDSSSGKTGLLTSKTGTAISLTVADNQTALFEFDLSNLDVVPAAIDPSNVKSAILELYVIKTNTAASLTVEAVTSPWSETFKAKTEPLPSIDPSPLAIIPVSEVPYKHFVSVDITSTVVAALASGSDLSIAIVTATPGAKITLGSKDGPAAGYEAALEIDAGLAGTSGPAGPTGPAGPSNTLTIGTVASGTAPAVSLTGSSPNQVINLTLAQGPQGATGPAGATGPQGATGLTGATGLAGATGPQGNPGAIGPTGATGATGPQGATGLTGATGLAGAMGPQGNPGAIGPTGATGATGPANSLTIGTVTDGATVGVTVSGTAPNQSLNFEIPDGQLPNNNTAIGKNAFLSDQLSGDANVAIGFQALLNNTIGNENVGVGSQVLQSNTSGYENTAIGDEAMADNGSGNSNTAVGDFALFGPNAGYSTGNYNVAIGHFALVSVSAGNANVGIGAYAGYTLTTGSDNTGVGYHALYGVTSGNNNVGIGSDACEILTTGNDNLGVGPLALSGITTGGNNIGIGYAAGTALVTGSNNIIIGDTHWGQTSSDSNTIRIGIVGVQNQTFIAGINGETTAQNDAVEVMIDGSGQLGTTNSSRRYKQDIHDMGDASTRLLRLRPVTFRYKQPYDNGERPIQFGLIAEEVAQEFPELAVFNAQGEPQTVKYQLLGSLLLNEFLKEHKRVEDMEKTVVEQEQQAHAMTVRLRGVQDMKLTVAAQAQTIAAQQKQIQALTASVRKMTRQMDAVAQRLDGKDYQPVADHMASVPTE